MRILLLLFFISFSSSGQIIEDKDYGKIDIRNINDKYISIEYWGNANGSTFELNTYRYKKD